MPCQAGNYMNHFETPPVSDIIKLCLDKVKVAVLAL